MVISGPRSRLPELKLAFEGLLDTLCTWFSQHGVEVNAGKTELLMCGEPHEPHVGPAAAWSNWTRRQLVQIGDRLRIEVMGELLQLPTTVKKTRCHYGSGTLLGTTIFIQSTHIKHIIPFHILTRIVDALVLSHELHCAAVYGSANRTSLARL